MISKKRRLHFVGIGGIGMSGIARLFHEKGYTISGSDSKRSSITDELSEKNIVIHIGHSADHIANAEVVIISSAVPRSLITQEI